MVVGIKSILRKGGSINRCIILCIMLCINFKKAIADLLINNSTDYVGFN